MGRWIANPAESIRALFQRRLAVLDPSEARLAVLIVEDGPGGVRPLGVESLDSEAESATENDEFREKLMRRLLHWRVDALVLVLPQERSIAQTVDMPGGADYDLRGKLEAEAMRISGLAEADLLFASGRLKPWGKFQNPYVLNLCRSREVWGLLEGFGNADPTGEEPLFPQIEEVVGSAEGLFAALLHLNPKMTHGIVAQVGMNSTVLGVIVERQGVFATTVPMGFLQMRGAGASPDWAERVTRENLFAGAEGPEMSQGAARWKEALRQIVEEWVEDHPEEKLELADLPFYVAAPGPTGRGLVAGLRDHATMPALEWPMGKTLLVPEAMGGCWAAFGAALQATGRTHRRVSFLPPDLLEAKRHARWWRAAQVLVLALLCVCACLMAGVTWRKTAEISRKTLLLDRTKAALESSEATERIARRLTFEYEQIQPVLRRQRHTSDLLGAMAAVRQARTNLAAWFVLFADSQSYFTVPSTNSPPVTNMVGLASVAGGTNQAPKREYIAEIVIPEDGEEMRRVLSQVVASLKTNSLFGRVDLLPAERKRMLVDPRVVISNHTFAISMQVRGRDPEPALPIPSVEPVPSAGTPGREPRRGGFMSRPRPPSDTGAVSTNR